MRSYKLNRKIKVLKDLGEYKPGDVVTVDVHLDGQPKSIFWRRRFKDAFIDNCVEFVEQKKAEKIVEKEEKEEKKKDGSKGEK